MVQLLSSKFSSKLYNSDPSVRQDSTHGSKETCIGWTTSRWDQWNSLMTMVMNRQSLSSIFKRTDSMRTNAMRMVSLQVSCSMLRLKWTQTDLMTWSSVLRVRLSKLTFTSIKKSKWHSSITRVHLSKYLSSLRSWWQLRTQKTMVQARLLMWSLVPCQAVSSRSLLSQVNLLRRAIIWFQLSQWRWSTSWKRQEMA